MDFERQAFGVNTVLDYTIYDFCPVHHQHQQSGVMFILLEQLHPLYLYLSPDVPQGSVLGPILFIIFSTLPCCKIKCHPSLLIHL